MKLCILLILVCCVAAIIEARSPPVKSTPCRSQTKLACTKSGKFKKRQCNDGVCCCVKAKTGKPRWKKVKFPADEKFSCKRKPTKCEKQRFKILVSGSKKVPNRCDKKGRPLPPTTLPPVTTAPPVVTTQPPVVTDPPVVTTQPPVVTTQPPVVTTQPPVVTTQPPVVTTAAPAGPCAQTIGGVVNLALNKPAKQSSIGWNGQASRGVDGNANPQWGGASCTHTQIQQGAWWEVDLGGDKSLHNVQITNRADCCSDRLSNFKVIVKKDASSVYEECANFPGPIGAGATQTIPCKAVARYVRIVLNGRNYLTLCEVKVNGQKCVTTEVPCSVSGGLENLALRRPCSQSSIGWNGEANRAVDGNLNALWGGASCTHTQSQPGAWWMVDLGGNANIDHVKITNRADCCSERLQNFHIRVRKDGSSNFEICANFAGRVGAGATQTVPCKTIARYVRIVLNKQNYLTLCEVQVLGRKCARAPVPCAVSGGITNVALRRPATQSSIGWNGQPTRALDGNANPQWGGASCTHTLNQLQAWWRVDLGGNTKIHSVKITNRADCCSERLSNFNVRVARDGSDDFEVCANFPGRVGAGATQTLACNAVGRYVTVALNGRNYLTLCEVQVLGQKCTGSGPAPACSRKAGMALLSQGKPTTSSPVGFGGHPGRAVDGNLNRHWGGASCTHTNLLDKPWWQVDLGSDSHINRVVLVNRQDCCSERLSNFVIKVRKAAGGAEQPCTQFGGRMGPGQAASFPCAANVIGRYVKVQLNGRNYLTLCEVQVFGQKCLN